MGRKRPAVEALPPKVFTREDRIKLGRCLQCEHHPQTQGHHRACPNRKDQP